MYSLPFERSLTGKKENLISYAKWRLVAYIR